MEGAGGHCIACGALWLRSSWCGPRWKTGKQWTVHQRELKGVRGSELLFAEQGSMDCRRHRGWIFLAALKVNMDTALCDVTPVRNVQRCLEELEQRILASEQEPHGPEEPSVSDSEAVRR